MDDVDEDEFLYGGTESKIEPIKAEEDKQETEQDQGKEQESSSDDEEDSDEDIEIVLTNDPRTSAAKEVETVKSKVQHKAGLDIDVVGQMDGTDIYDVDVDGIEDKPWRKPGADITDYFNFGFNELSWKLYSNKQRAVRDSTSSLGNEQMMQQMMMNPMIMQQMMSMSQQFRPPFSQQQFHSPPTQNHLPHKRQRIEEDEEDNVIALGGDDHQKNERQDRYNRR